jgi:hypothetical protein
MKSAGCFIFWTVVAVYFFSFHWLFAPMNYIEGLSSIAKIEQLKEDLQNVNAIESEDVIGQVTEWNQEIRSNQRYNQIPIAGLYIPDYWDDVELIPLPER